MCLFVAVGFFAALLWARNRDPFTRMEFSLRTPHAGKTEGMVVLPKPAARFPVVVFLHGSGGSVPASGKILRQFAELGCAAVAIEYSQTNQLHFNEQLLALNQYLKGRKWAQSNAVAWVGFSLGAQRSLSFLLTHPEVQPQLYVRVAGGLVEELKDKPLTPSLSPSGGERVASSRERGVRSETPPSTLNLPSRRSPAKADQPSTIQCPILLIHGEGDEVFPVADCEKLGALMQTNGVKVETRILPGLPHAFGEDKAVVMRAVVEYCATHLPLADYAAALPGCNLTSAETERFNAAMSRAGSNRRQLWKAVTSTREPERRTTMMLIGGMEDHDLAHISARHLEETVNVAWKARRSYPWCRDTPLDVFEKFTASPRVFDEPLERVQLDYQRKLRPVVKYCRTMADVCDTVGRWERLRAVWKSFPGAEDPIPSEVLANGGGDCQHLISLFISLARPVGVAARPVTTTWPILGSGHYWAEIWDVDRQSWHGFDGSAAERPFDYDWMMRVPKAATHAATGERGGWNARRENRWDAYTNTVGLFYPSGTVRVKVLERNAPKVGQRVNVEVWVEGRMAQMTSARTDERGEARFTLGQSARSPYRFVLAGKESADWEWLAVQAGRHYEITLHPEQGKPFDPATEPPALGFPAWINPNSSRSR